MSKNRHRTPKKQPILDVVVTCAGRFDMLEKCLDVLYQEAQFTPLTITVADIDSPRTDREQNKHLLEYHPEKDPAGNVVGFYVKRYNENVGFPKGVNGAARERSAPLLMIINDDVELFQGSIVKVVNTFQDQTIGIVGVKLIYPTNSTRQGYPAGKVQHVGLSLNIRAEPVHPLVGWSPSNPKTCVSRDVWAVTGACLTIRRNLWNQVRGFDEIYGKGTWEDADICLKVRQMGKRVFVNTDVMGYHYTGASQEKRKELFPLQFNMSTFQTRWGNSGMLVWDEWSYL